METNANNGVTAGLKDGSYEQNEQESRVGHLPPPWKFPNDTRDLTPTSLVPSLSAVTDFHAAGRAGFGHHYRRRRRAIPFLEF
jgi:hypothetical protein